MEKLTYLLVSPVQFTPTRLVEELRFRPKVQVRDLKSFDRADGRIGATIQLLAMLSGEPAELIEALDAEDYLKILEFLRPFFPSFLGIGVG